MHADIQHRYRRKILMAGLLVLSCYGLGLVFPEAFWATNNPGLLPPVGMVSFFLLTALLFLVPFWWKYDLPFGNVYQAKSARKNFLFALGGVVAAFIYAQFPIHTDVYGDAYFIKQAVDLQIPQWDNRLLLEPLQPDWLDTKVGLKSFYEINNFFTWLTGANGVKVAQTLGYVSGGLFAFLWLKFTDLHLKDFGWKTLFVVVGLSTPLVQVFMGHYETYMLSYTGILLWMSALGVYFKTESGKWLWALPFIFLFVLQTHITNWLLFPTLGMAFVWHYRKRVSLAPVAWLDGVIRKRFPGYRGGLTWSGLLVYYFVPAVVLGLLAYFVLTGNFDGPRKFSDEEFEDALFLPLFTAEAAPYDRYNLLSWPHFLDYLNLLFMWGGAVLLLLVPPLTFLRKRIPWNAPLVLLSAATALLMSLVFFVLNPLLSMGIDWDLYATPALVVLPMLVFIYAHLEAHLSLRMLAGPVLGLCLLGTSFMVVNSNSELLARRLDHLGRWEFKTYWIGSSTSLLVGAELNTSPEEAQQRRMETIADLRPYAAAGNDKEFAGLLQAAGRYHLDTQVNQDSALIYFEEAHAWFPRLGSNIYDLTVTHFAAGHVPEAYRYAELLDKIKHPPYQRTLKIAIHVSLAAKEYQSAANYAVTYMNRWEDDPVILEVERRLRTGDRIATIVDLFRK